MHVTKFIIEYTRKTNIQNEKWSHLCVSNIKSYYNSHEDARKACEKVYVDHGGFNEFTEHNMSDEYKYYHRMSDDIYVFRIKNNIDWKVGFEKIVEGIL